MWKPWEEVCARFLRHGPTGIGGYLHQAFRSFLMNNSGWYTHLRDRLQHSILQHKHAEVHGQNRTLNGTEKFSSSPSLSDFSCFLNFAFRRFLFFHLKQPRTRRNAIFGLHGDLPCSLLWYLVMCCKKRENQSTKERTGSPGRDSAMPKFSFR